MTNGGAAQHEEDGDHPFEIAADIAEKVRQGAQPGVIELSNGIRLRLRPINRLLISQATSRIIDPEPPMADIGKGREEPNYDDPDFRLELLRRQALRVTTASSAAIVLGTSIELPLPEGMFGPEQVGSASEPGWLQQAQLVDDLLEGDEAVIPSEIRIANVGQRYLSWINKYACTTDEDIAKFQVAIYGLLGVTEDAVNEAAAAFRATAAGGGPEPVSPQPSGPNPDNRRTRRTRSRAADR